MAGGDSADVGDVAVIRGREQLFWGGTSCLYLHAIRCRSGGDQSPPHAHVWSPWSRRAGLRRATGCGRRGSSWREGARRSDARSAGLPSARRTRRRSQTCRSSTCRSDAAGGWRLPRTRLRLWSGCCGSWVRRGHGSAWLFAPVHIYVTYNVLMVIRKYNGLYLVRISMP